MIYEVMLNSQLGPYEIGIEPDAEAGNIKVWLPRSDIPIVVKNERVRISVQVPGPPVPITIKAWRPVA